MPDCLVVLNPRAIQPCLESFRKAGMDIGWLTGYSEPQLEEAMGELLASTDYDRYIVSSDDTVISRRALDAVIHLLDRGHLVATGYCPLDRRSHLVNLTTRPLGSPIPSMVAYDFWRRVDVQLYPQPAVPTCFVGMALTGMSKEMWERYPLSVSPLGKQTDYSLSYRLQEAGIPMVAAREGMVRHVKEKWNHPDQEEAHRLLIGEVEPKVWLEEK